MAPINSKKREASKLNKRCLTLDEKIKILDEVKKRKLSCKAIAEEFKIGKTQVANVVKNAAKLREEYANCQGKGFKHIKRENHQKFKPINDTLYSWFNPLNANPEKWSNTFKQIVGNLPTICLSVFDHFMNLALKGLKGVNHLVYMLTGLC